MEGGGGGAGITPKILHLQRALSGGFGFSLMGGRGTGFPPVICDILVDSPASECEGMQVGDIILEINHEGMENKSTKEVVTALMKSPDDLILKVNEDRETRERVLKFLAPLDRDQAFQNRSQKTTVISSKPKVERREYTTNDNERVWCSPEEVKENGEKSETESAENSNERLRSGATNGESEQSRILQSPVLPNRTLNGPSGEDLSLKEDQRIPEIVSEQLTDKSTSHSCNSDLLTDDAFVGQKFTTTALIHRENSAKEGGLSQGLAQSAALNKDPQRLDKGCVLSSEAVGVSKVTPEKEAFEQSAVTEVNMNGRSKAELVCVTSAQLPTARTQNEETKTVFQTGTNVSRNNDTSLSNGAFISTSPVKVKTTVTNITSDMNVPSEIIVGRTEQPKEVSQGKSLKHAIGIQTNPADLEYRMGNGTVQGPFGAFNSAPGTHGHTKVNDSRSASSVESPGARLKDTDSSGDENEFPDMDSLESALHENPKNLDVPSAKRLAKRLYDLDGFKREDVSIHLSKRNDFSKLVAKEYLGYFDFTNKRVDEALRDFLRCVTIVGETQERERVLEHFSQHYYDCNPAATESPDAAHTLVCSVMLLNTDLHGQNIGKKMTLNAFMANLEGMNDGTNYPRAALKALYNAIKLQPLEWIADDEEDDDGSDEGTSVRKGSKKLAKNGTTINPLVSVDDDPNAPVYIQGYIMRKVTIDAEGKKTPKGKRGWKMYYATVKGLCLFLHKSEVAKETAFDDPKDVMRLHHSLASRTSQYDKKPSVFVVRLANWSEYLLQCVDNKEMQNWMQAINMAAAVHSSPPLPSAIGSQVGFQRPVLPTAASRLDPGQQLASHDEKVEALERELEDHRSYPPDKKTKPKFVKDYKAKDEYLEYEVSRFKAYIYLLRSQPLHTLPTKGTPPSSSSSSSSSSLSSGGGKKSLAPPPKFATYSTLSRSSSTSSASSVSSSSSSKSMSGFNTIPASRSSSHRSAEGSANSKPALRKTNSSAISPSEEGPPPMRDNSNKMDEESDGNWEIFFQLPLENDDDYSTDL